MLKCLCWCCWYLLATGSKYQFYRRGEKTAKEFEDELFDDVVRATTTMAPVSDSGWSEIQTRKRKTLLTHSKKEENTHAN